jgi:hypothetical protein
MASFRIKYCIEFQRVVQRLKMAALVPGLEGSTILEQMQKLFEPPGGEQTLR